MITSLHAATDLIDKPPTDYFEMDKNIFSIALKLRFVGAYEDEKVEDYFRVVYG